MNLRSSIKFPKLKMLDDCVHNMLMSLSLNKFLLTKIFLNCFKNHIRCKHLTNTSLKKHIVK